MSHRFSGGSVSLTEGSIVKGMLSFAIPFFWGQLLQQMYNMADAWVVGNFADNAAFAAISSSASLIFLIVGFFNGIGIGGGVVISRYFGAGDEKKVEKSIHTNFLFGIIASVVCTVAGLLLVPHILRWMGTPTNVLPQSMIYFRIYCAGVSTVIMYNICMSIMRAVGDSLHPLYYLLLSSVINVALDMILVAGFHTGVAGAAAATVVSQGISAGLCVLRMCRGRDCVRLDFGKLRLEPSIMREVICQGIPTGIQNSVISIGNIVVQSNINSFGEYAIAGVGAYSRIEGFVFLPIMSMSMALTTFISQNLGAKKYDRAKKGAAFGIVSGVVTAELIGILFYLTSARLLRIFISSPEAIRYGVIHAKTVTLFFCLLSFSHCAAGVIRGCGKSVVPMVGMLAFWCGVRITYITVILKIIPEFRMIACAYPLTWSLTSVVFALFLAKSDWTHAFERSSSAV